MMCLKDPISKYERNKVAFNDVELTEPLSIAGTFIHYFISNFQSKFIDKSIYMLPTINTEVLI